MSEETELETFLNNISNKTIKEHCSYLLGAASIAKDVSIINLQQAIDVLKKMRIGTMVVGSYILVADYLDSLSKIDEQDEREAIRHKFLELAILWAKESKESGHPYSHLVFEHPIYQQIVELGEPVVPFLLEGLEKGTGYWFYALRKITGVEPIPLRLQYEPSVPEMDDIWLEWGCNNGYR